MSCASENENAVSRTSYPFTIESVGIEWVLQVDPQQPYGFLNNRFTLVEDKVRKEKYII